MSEENSDRWTSGVSPEIPPPRQLYGEVVARLRQDGELRRTRHWTWWAAAASIVVAFAAGWASSRYASPQVAPAGDRYVLLLYGDAQGREADLVSEYGAWARAARTNGRFMTGERLDDSAMVLGGTAADTGARVSGFFVFTAPSRADAEALAKSHPHLRHGGRIVLRRILPT